jgi:hypothetical protein
MIKTETMDSLSLQLQKLLKAAEFYGNADLRSKVIRELDHTIDILSKMRNGLMEESLREKSLGAIESIRQILQFLEDAKSDKSFQVMLSDILSASVTEKRPDAESVEIPPNLTNQQIKDLLERNLSKAALKQIAEQRSISSGKRSIKEIRAAILSFIERQESYDQLRAG